MNLNVAAARRHYSRDYVPFGELREYLRGVALVRVIKITGELTAAKISFLLAGSDMHITWHDTV